jgi:chromosome segregation protein
MRVDKIELLGFKSFSEKTILNLHPGITCIVGPNGCGKSNVVDSFKWVLGEQSAKSLRGDKMEQVIFTGSQSRKPKGMAEVRLVVSGLISNPDNGGDAPLAVARRLYRSGDSDYMINRNICRLRDIRDIFLDTGLEVKSYSILEQDRIAAILSAKPEERRFILEEVAGVVKYKVRRVEAESKLESSRNNLQRINDVIAEIRRQINSLDRQVKRAERFKKLSEELRLIELRLARHEYSRLNEELDGILSEHGAIKEEDALKRSELSRAEADIEAGRIGLVEKEKALNELQLDLQGRQKEIAEHERSIAVLRTECDSLRENIGRLRQEEEETLKKLASAGEREEEIATLLGSLDGEVSALSGTMQEQEQSLDASEGEISRTEALLEERRREAFTVSDELGGLRNAQGRHLEALDALKRKQEGLNRESAELGSHLEGVRAELHTAEGQIKDRESEAASLGQRKETIDKEVNALREKLEALRLEILKEREELASAVSRLDSLKEMVVSEGADSELGEDVDIVAPVADIIEVPEEYERAIESALREAAGGLVLRASEDVLKAVAAVKAKDIGRTAFMHLGTEGFSGDSSLPEGAVAWAADLVTVKDEFKSVLKNLLANVVVVRDVEAALGMRGRGMTFVTLEGETVEPSGAVIAGKSRGILALKRQIRELGEEIETRKSSITALESRTQETQGAIGDKEQELQSVTEKAVETEREISLLKLKVEGQAEEIERAERKLGVIRMEQEQAEREKASLDALIEEKGREISRLEEDRKRVDAAISEIQADISARRAGHEQRRAESVDLRLKLSSMGERMNSLRNETESVRGLKGELSRKSESVKREIALAGERIGEREAEAKQKEDELKERVVRASEIEARMSSERDLISADSDGIRSKEQGLRGLRTAIESLAQKLSELDVQRAEHRVMLDNLVENIRNAYSVELGEVEEEPVAEDDHDRRDELKMKIEKLGPVSLGSIEEYEELKERYDFLNQQQEDLNRSIAELEEAITRINSTTRKNLREAYEALRVKFGEVFEILFGGGHAELVLTDERNILETGVDIVAQPLGKKLQNINLLSGGEKSLTALALLFASFLIKPTPLCILDEADAALDESNTLKFSEMLKELSKDIQFIVITHNRVTMEAADYIYGITMEEPGVSKVISMQLTEA